MAWSHGVVTPTGGTLFKAQVGSYTDPYDLGTSIKLSATQPRFLDYNTSGRRADGRVAIGCKNFEAAELRRLIAESDRMVRRSRSVRRELMVTVRDAHEPVKMIVRTDGGIAMASRYPQEQHAYEPRAGVLAFARTHLNR